MLREDVYNYLWKQIREKKFIPGQFVDMTSIAKMLNISRTPLREALIILENEGFVKILPKKGIYVNALTLKDIYNLFEIIGSLESGIIMNNWHKITPEIVIELEKFNSLMMNAATPAEHYELNRKFHFIYIDLSDNQEIKRYLARLYRRIYDFSGINFGEQFQLNNSRGHQEFIQLLKEGKQVEAANYLRDHHWKFRVPEIFTSDSSA